MREHTLRQVHGSNVRLTEGRHGFSQALIRQYDGLKIHVP